MGVIVTEGVGDGDIKHINDERNHDREESDAREHTQQTHPSYKQEKP